MHFHAFVEGREEEVVLIVRSDLPLVGEPVEVDLVVGGLTAQG
jgi:hypothetical protein